MICCRLWLHNWFKVKQKKSTERAFFLKSWHSTTIFCQRKVKLVFFFSKKRISVAFCVISSKLVKKILWFVWYPSSSRAPCDVQSGDHRLSPALRPRVLQRALHASLDHILWSTQSSSRAEAGKIDSTRSQERFCLLWRLRDKVNFFRGQMRPERMTWWSGERPKWSKRSAIPESKFVTEVNRKALMERAQNQKWINFVFWLWGGGWGRVGRAIVLLVSRNLHNGLTLHPSCMLPGRNSNVSMRLRLSLSIKVWTKRDRLLCMVSGLFSAMNTFTFHMCGANRDQQHVSRLMTCFTFCKTFYAFCRRRRAVRSTQKMFVVPFFFVHGHSSDKHHRSRTLELRSMKRKKLTSKKPTQDRHEKVPLRLPCRWLGFLHLQFCQKNCRPLT